MLPSKENSAIFRSSVYMLQLYAQMIKIYKDLSINNISPRVTPRGDMVIIRKQWNARVCHDTVTMNSLIDKHGIRIQCANGEGLFYVCRKA